MTEDIKHTTDQPPVWGTLQERYGVSWNTTVVAYGDTIHSARLPLPADIEVHERVHLRQHGYTQAGAAEWWKRYLDDPKFRYEQELEAYRAQYQFLRKTVKDRNALTQKTDKLARCLSGTMYGNLATYNEALKAITK